ncbi:MAG TPA: MCE family protein [Marmoricola sp.]|nr:MCE family protein [Marmoricola sp.]
MSAHPSPRRALGTRLRRRVAGHVVLLLSGLLALTGCGSIYDLPLPGGASVNDPITVHVMFRDVMDLVPQSTVKVDDITVGKVTAIKLQGYHADVTIEIPRSTGLPANTMAEIRQTSLLGEKFISLSAPPDPQGHLGNNDVINLDHTGRNPEVEEVLGALALLLNGGGVGQLKTIATELNNAVGGRESDVRSVITQLHTFMGQLDQNKAAIVSAIDNVNRLAAELRQQDGTITKALDDVPAALKSLNGQRADLVRMLQSLQRLSGVGVRVIKASKASTIDSLRDLAPVLTAFAKAGEDMPKALQVFLTYPFADAAVGQDPQVARNLHMGDFTNLSIRLEMNLQSLNLPSNPVPTSVTSPVVQGCRQLRQQVIKAIEQSNLPDSVKKELVKAARNAKCSELADPQKFISDQLTQICKTVAIPGVCPTSGSTSLPSLPLPTPTGTGGLLGGLGLGRPAPGAYRLPKPADPYGLARHGIDASLGTLLLQGVAS